MFCQQCGASAPESSKFCKQCGRRLKTSISNKALLLAGVAAIVSVGTSLPLLLSGDEPSKAQETPTPIVALASPSPSPKVSPSPLLRVVTRPRPIATPDYPYRHTPILQYPLDGNLFSYRYSLGKIKFRWRVIAGSEATGYKLEVEHGDPSHRPPWELRDFETPWNYYTVDFRGETTEITGRWRVAPIFTGGRLGAPTEWRTFRFTQ